MTAKVKGVANLQQTLAQLQAQLDGPLGRSALRVGAAVIADAARENLGGRHATLKGGRKVLIASNIKVSTNARHGMVTAKVQLKGEAAYVGPWLEYGTDPHFISVDPEFSGGAHGAAHQPAGQES